MWIHVSYLKTWWLNLLLHQLSAKHLFEAQRAPAHAADFSGLKFDLWSTSNSHDFKIQLDGLRYRTEKKTIEMDDSQEHDGFQKLGGIPKRINFHSFFHQKPSL